MPEIVFKEESYRIIGACFEVFKEMGSGFLEPVYQEALEIELRERNIPFEAQKVLKIYYKGKPLEKEYVADLSGYGQIIVELKALDRITGKEEAQLLNYLKATGFEVGILINFGGPSLEFKRIVRTERGGEEVDLRMGVKKHINSRKFA